MVTLSVLIVFPSPSPTLSLKLPRFSSSLDPPSHGPSQLIGNHPTPINVLFFFLVSLLIDICGSAPSDPTPPPTLSLPQHRIGRCYELGPVASFQNPDYKVPFFSRKYYHTLYAFLISPLSPFLHHQPSQIKMIFTESEKISLPMRTSLMSCITQFTSKCI